MAPKFEAKVPLTFHEERDWQGHSLVPAYMELMAETLSSNERDGLLSCTRAELEAPDVSLKTLLRAIPGEVPRIVAALRCHYRPDEVYFAGAVVDRAFRGMRLLGHLVQHASSAEAERNPRCRHVCIVRTYRSGEFNHAAMRSFMAGRFMPKRMLSVPFQNSPADQHLRDSLEAGGFFRALEMEALAPRQHATPGEGDLQ